MANKIYWVLDNNENITRVSKFKDNGGAISTFKSDYPNMGTDCIAYTKLRLAKVAQIDKLKLKKSLLEESLKPILKDIVIIEEQLKKLK